MKKFILFISAISMLATVGCKNDEDTNEVKKTLPTPDKGTVTNTAATNETSPEPLPDDGKANGYTTVTPETRYLITPNVGGANEPNQVYVDLSTKETFVVKRDAWDLAFYCGNDDFRVILNASLAMTVKPTDNDKLETFIQKDESMIVGKDNTNLNMPIANHYIDEPSGLFRGNGTKGTGTAIAQIAERDQDNKIYLLNMGYTVSDVEPKVGGVNTLGDHRGWKKIKIVRHEQGYKITYADHNVSRPDDFKTIIVKKDPAYNFVFLNLSTGNYVRVQPKKKNWDLCFTTYTSWRGANREQASNPANGVAFFPDIVTVNIHGGTRNTFFKYTDKEERDRRYPLYTKEKALKVNFNDEKYNNQMYFGRVWRDPINDKLRDDLIFVVKDNNENYFKIKMLGYKNDEGKRGYPSFEYELLK